MSKTLEEIIWEFFQDYKFPADRIDSFNLSMRIAEAGFTKTEDG